MDANAPLPGGDLPGRDRDAWLAQLSTRYPMLSPAALRALAHRHGTRALRVLGDAKRPADLGDDFGAELTAREIDYLAREEWARTADDVLWRRTKCGLPMTQAQRDARRRIHRRPAHEERLPLLRLQRRRAAGLRASRRPISAARSPRAGSTLVYGGGSVGSCRSPRKPRSMREAR